MPVGAAIGAVGSIASAGIGYMGAKNAANEQAKAAQNALNFQKEVYASNKANLQPWIGTGTNAMYSLASLYGLPTPNNPGGGGTNQAWEAFKNLPAYTFPFEQGNLALSRQLNAQGRQQSGAQARASQQFGQGLASQYLMSNYVNPLMQLSGQGQSAAGNLANVGTAAGNQVGQSYGNIGAANASGIVGGTNALMGGINNLATYSALANNGMGGSSTYSLSGPSWGGGNIFNSAWGGSSNNPLPGLNPEDYGAGF